MSKIPRLSTSSSTRRSRFASSFVRLNMKPNTGAGPINRLPNEMMQMIVAKLGLDGNVHELVRLRLVSTKWRAVIEDYCGQKKSLLVVMGPKWSDHDEVVFDAAAHKEHVKNNFFGFGNSKDFARLGLVPESGSYQRLTSLLKIFTNIVQLSIYCCESTETTYFVLYINSLASLKQLNLFGAFSPDQFAQSAILSKLEHFSISRSPMFAYPVRPSSKQSSMKLVTQLGPSCVRFKFIYFVPGDLNDIFQWHTNLLWLANLTHLAIRFGITNDHLELARVVPYLSEHATSLKHLSFDVLGFRPLELSPAVIGHLAKLTHLAELDVCNIAFRAYDLEKLAAEARLTPLSSVLTCKLRVYFYGSFGLPADRFTRGLSTIFPNLDDLYLTIYVMHDWYDAFNVEQHLKLLVRKHKFRLVILD